MKLGLGLYRSLLTDDNFKFAKQAGVTHLVVHLVDYFKGADPADAIFLDAYDAEAGAGEFYAKCGFVEVAHVSYRGVPLVYYQMLLPPE